MRPKFRRFFTLCCGDVAATDVFVLIRFDRGVVLFIDGKSVVLSYGGRLVVGRPWLVEFVAAVTISGVLWPWGGWGKFILNSGFVQFYYLHD